MKFLFLLILFVIPPGFNTYSNENNALSPISIKGYVFVDLNNNGIRDKNEKGVKDVVVSDQVETTVTNEQGFYQLESTSNFGFVFISQPKDYLINGSMWKAIPQDQPNVVIDFLLTLAPKATNFTFIHASDTHINEQGVERLQKLKLLTDSLKPAFVLITGDLVKDAVRVTEKEASSLFQLYVREINKFQVPIWAVPGNHDIFGIERQYSLVSKQHPLYGKNMCRRYLGPDYYSFNYGGVHFIGINSVDYQDLWYYGHIDSTQLAWIQKDLAYISKTTPVVTFNHIPFYSGGFSLWQYEEEPPNSTLITINGKKYYRHLVDNSREVISLLKGYNYPLALAGHYHSSQQFKFDSETIKTRFNQTGAVVGPGNSAGLVMPSGVTLYSVENGKINEGKFIPLR